MSALAAFGADPCEGAGPLALPRDIFETEKQGRAAP
jgi:hypothetical protein